MQSWLGAPARRNWALAKGLQACASKETSLVSAGPQHAPSLECAELPWLPGEESVARWWAKRSASIFSCAS